MRRSFLALALMASLQATNAASALVNIALVPVGDVGNVGKWSNSEYGGYGPDRVCGGVNYAYSIGKYEVTAGQYSDFLNAVAKTDTYSLYNPEMWNDINFGCKIQQTGSSGSYIYTVDSGFVNRPVNYVSFWDACRFTNWLQNGQKSGVQDASTTESGAYSLNGVMNPSNSTITRNTGTTWAVTSEDEWCKAAYYKGGGINAGFWLYPTQNDYTPSNVLSATGLNNANYIDSYGGGVGNGGMTDSRNYRTEVGAFAASPSAYGTYDQGGNVWEWNEAVIDRANVSYRGVRGGAFSRDVYFMKDGIRHSDDPSSEGDSVGFRVSQVPEPASLGIIGLGVIVVLAHRRRSA